MSAPESASAIEYAANILRNPRNHFGTWTPKGWRTHVIRKGRTAARRIARSGDGKSVKFAGMPDDYAECIHDAGDVACDGGIYPSTPRVEYPPGRPRWAISHSFLAYPVADQTLYEYEYTWDREEGSLATYFRKHVPLEEAITDAQGGLSVKVRGTPISTVVAGNKAYPYCNSAVRGVWDNPEKKGHNYYTRKHVRRCASHNAVYVLVTQQPVVQCHGIWKLEPRDASAFDSSGVCREEALLIANGVPLDCPKLGVVGYELKRVPSRFYGGTVEIMARETVRIDPAMLDALRGCLDASFQEGNVGFAAWKSWDHAMHINGVPGSYAFAWDFNADGVVDDADEQTLRANLGREVRVNYYSAAYFGNNWLSTGVLLNPEMEQGEPLICAWTQGAGYTPGTGIVDLFETPGPNRPVYVEYHHDEPAAQGRENIQISLPYLEKDQVSA